MSTETRSVSINQICLLLLALSMATVLAYQVLLVSRQTTTLAETRSQVGGLLQQRESVAHQSATSQARLQSIAADLLALSKTNANAAAIVQKYNIRHTGAVQ